MISDYLRKLQGLKNGTVTPEPKKKQDPPAKRSEKMKEEMKLYKPQVKEFLARPENCDCGIRFKGCTGKAVCVHHSAGRTGKQLLNEADWVPSCASCNLAVETSDAEAREKGFKKSRLTKVVK